MKKALFSSAVAAFALSAMVATSATAQSAPKEDPLKEMDEFMAVYKRVKASYVDKVDDKQLMEGAIQGMLNTLDPHSAFLDKSDFQSLQTQIDGEYGGLGLSVTLEDGAPTIDTPADKAGIKSGDYITHLDSQLIVGGTLDEAVNRMRGEPGTSIKLTIFRPGREEPFDVSITRAIIDLKPVRWEVKDKIGVITITGFSEETGEDVAAAVKGIEKQMGGKPLGYIVDLRSNPGGNFG
jgi:carboxyl-terminal processing protease